MNYFIKTFGCQMNVHESEKIAGILKDKGYCETDRTQNADIIVFNTCCIRENAENKALGNLGAVKRLKRLNKELIIVLCGCMTQQDGVAVKIKERFPFVDIILGTHNLHLLGEKVDLVNQARAQSKKETLKGEIDIWEEFRAVSALTVMPERRKGTHAWLNIMYGCNNFCSYCIVPFVRGRERSRPYCEIEAELISLIDLGYKEITLLGQNVNSYGTDNASNITFSELLRKLTKLDGDFRIKFMTSHPKDFNQSIIDIMAESDKLAKQIHLPIQSGSNNILKAMNRKYTKEDYLLKIESFKKALPDAGITSDIMVGFPGETEADFLETMQLVEKVRFDNLYMFEYSKRSGTKAASLENQISSEIKTDRIKRLIELQRKIGNERSREQIGKSKRALIESVENGTYIATTDCGRIALIDQSETQANMTGIESTKPHLIGEFHSIEITSARGGKLRAKIID